MRDAGTFAAAQFEVTTARHQLVEAASHGSLRRLVFREPGRGAYWFDVVTWPGSLCIEGDMGCYVFRRLADMFEFFRCSDASWPIGSTKAPPINPHYWSEKLVSVEARRGVQIYSPDKFRAKATERVTDRIEQGDLDESRSEALRDEVERDVLRSADDGEHEAIAAAMRFVSEFDPEFHFHDFWEVDCREYSTHFLWSCHAIVWAIRQYDLRTTTVSA